MPHIMKVRLCKPPGLNSNRVYARKIPQIGPIFDLKVDARMETLSDGRLASDHIYYE